MAIGLVVVQGCVLLLAYIDAPLWTFPVIILLASVVVGFIALDFAHPKDRD